MNQKIVDKIGWFAALMGMVMFLSYIDQIRLNISGQIGSVILPIATLVNCAAWSSYGFLKAKKDWPMIISNGFGVVLSTIAAITAIIFN